MGTTSQESVDAILDLVRRQLGMEVAFISEVTGDSRSFRAIVSEIELPVAVGDVEDYEGTYCQMITSGQLEQVVNDAPAHAVAADLRHTTVFGIGTYVGVPLLRSNGDLFGTLCAFSRETDPMVRDGEVEVLSATAELLMRIIENEADVGFRLASIVDSVEQAMGSTTEIELVPVTAVESGAVTGYEATPRFLDQTSLGRRLHEARDLGRGVAHELSLLVKVLDRLPDADPDLSVSVTLSASAILDPAFVAVMADVPPGRVVVTLDVQDPVADYALVNAVLQPMRRLGTLIGITNVGSGHAEMQHILLLEPDVIRIDADWVTLMGQDARRRAFVESLAALAIKIDAQAIAVGVESADALAWARELGVTHVQGQCPQKDRRD